jgi:hypothetical protein
VLYGHVAIIGKKKKKRGKRQQEKKLKVEW